MPPPGQSGKRRRNVLDLSVRSSVRPSVRPSVYNQTCEHDILTTTERRQLAHVVHGARQGHKNDKLWGQEVKVQGHTIEAENRFGGIAETFSTELPYHWQHRCKKVFFYSCHVFTLFISSTFFIIKTLAKIQRETILNNMVDRLLQCLFTYLDFRPK